jgi:hypothetical protein
VNATIENTGDESGTQTVEFRVNGAVQNSTTLTLGAGDTREVSFALDTDSRSTGTLTHSVVTADDTRTARLTVDAPKTVAEAVAGQETPDDRISLDEIQRGIDQWTTGAEVPGTGGETISLDEIKRLIDIWATGEPISDSDSDRSADADDLRTP